MKKLLFTLFVGLYSLGMQAQEIWLEAGLKGGYGLSFLYNSNIIDDDTYKYQLTSAYGIGGRLAMNFGPFNGLSVEGMYNTLGQDFEYTFQGGTQKLANKVTWKTVDVYLLYRYIRNRVFVELGPMYSLVQKVEQNDNGTELTGVAELYEKNYFAGVFGWGGYIAGSNTFSLNLGMRLHYSFSDLVNSKGQAIGLPNGIKDASYADYKSSHPAYVMITVEMNFGIGSFAKTACSERMQFFRSRG